MSSIYPIRELAWTRIIYPDDQQHRGIGCCYVGYEFEQVGPRTFRPIYVLDDALVETAWRYRRDCPKSPIDLTWQDPGWKPAGFLNDRTMWERTLFGHFGLPDPRYGAIWLDLRPDRFHPGFYPGRL
jgi:hypothetical protein